MLCTSSEVVVPDIHFHPCYRWCRDGCAQFLHPSLLWCMHEKDRWQDDVSLLAVVKISDDIRATTQDTEQQPDDQYWNTSIHPANTPLARCRYRVTGSLPLWCEAWSMWAWLAAVPPSIWATRHILIRDPQWLRLEIHSDGRQPQIGSVAIWIGQLMNAFIL